MKTFAKLLHDAMEAKKMTASDVARAVWGTTKDYRGYEVAKGRDRIGHYLAGASRPGRANLITLAKALDMPVKMLSDALPAPKVREERKLVEIKELTNDRAMLKVHGIIVSLKAARKVRDMIEQDTFGLF